MLSSFQDQESATNEAIADTSTGTSTTGEGSTTASFPKPFDCEPEGCVRAISKEGDDEEATPRESSPLRKTEPGFVPNKVRAN